MGVAVQCGYVTIQLVLLYAILGPFCLGDNPCRLLIFAGLFSLFCCAAYLVLQIGRTASPDYVDLYQEGVILASLLATIATALVIFARHILVRVKKNLHAAMRDTVSRATRA